MGVGFGSAGFAFLAWTVTPRFASLADRSEDLDIPMALSLEILSTLEDAMKLTRKNVADSLEGLPPIKMHCSNLAADGLHAAILDYYKKQGNKKMLAKYASLKPHEEEHSH